MAGTKPGHDENASKSQCRTAPPSLRLVDIPEDRRGRAVEHTGKRFPPRDRGEILPERDVDHLVIGFLLDVGGDLLLLFGRGRTRKRIAHRFYLGVFRPTEPAALRAPAADRYVGERAHHV